MEFWPDETAYLTIQKGKNQPEPATAARTKATARALRDIQPDGADPAASVFGLTGGGPGLSGTRRSSSRLPGRGVQRTQRPDRHGAADGGRRSADRGSLTAGAMEARLYGGSLHLGRGRRRGAEVVDLALVYSSVLISWYGI